MKDKSGYNGKNRDHKGRSDRNVPQARERSSSASSRNDHEEMSPDRLEGRNPITEALKSGREINKIWILQPSDGKKLEPALAAILNEALDRKIVVNRVSRTVLDNMSQTHNHQGVIAAVASHEYVDIEDIIKKAEDDGHAPLLVVLDELKDAYNLGSILRISDAAGVDGIIIPKHRSVGLDAAVAKASAGAIEYVPVARVTNIAQTLRELKNDHGFWVCGTAMEGSVDYDKADYKGALAIVIGSEGDGMRNTVTSECDFLVSIPMTGQVNSLNAAVAAGIVIYEAVRQRKE